MTEPIDTMTEESTTKLVETVAEQSTTGKKRDQLLGTLFADRYELISVIGRGATTTVYKAKDNKLNLTVAVKVLRNDSIFNEQLTRRFEQECHTLAMLTHANIVKLFDSGVSESEQPYLVMEYVDGTSLKGLIETDNSIDFVRVLKIFVQICAALGAAHERGIVHRDMKPANIMITKNADGEDLVKLLDFGVAKILVQGDTFQTKTQTGEMLGTLLYMSPEQCLEQVLDERCDVYSVGCVLFETLTGKPPLIGRTAFETMNKHLTEMPPKLSKVRPDRHFDSRLDVAVAVAMAKDPKDRYQTIGDFQSALSAILESIDDFHEEEPEEQLPATAAPTVTDSSTKVLPELRQNRELEPIDLRVTAALVVALVFSLLFAFFVQWSFIFGVLIFAVALVTHLMPKPVSQFSEASEQQKLVTLTDSASTDDSSRAGTVYFLAMEAVDGVAWRTIYKEQMDLYNIEESEVVEMKSSLLAAQESAWRDVKTYVMSSFRKLDADNDGFVTVAELEAARAAASPLQAREEAFLTFLIRNMSDIQTIVKDSPNPEKGIRREDLSEYFLHLENEEKHAPPLML
ncbi:MAG TPA: serine/threonine-protein kinase [Drouetiella sp.]